MKLFAGCYTKKLSPELDGKGEGIYAYEFDTSTGQLELKHVTKAICPSYLTLSEDQRYLYALEEVPLEDHPKVHAYKIDGYQLILVNSQELPGAYCCHLAISKDQKNLLIASYWSGTILNFPINADGSLEPLSQTISHVGTGSNKERQEAPHAHMIHPFGKNHFYGVDLGIDQAKGYQLVNGKIQAHPSSDLPVSPGAGARHMVVDASEQYAFVFCELDAKIYSFCLSEEKPRLIESVPTLPGTYQETPSGAAIRLHPNGRFLYASNRGSDSISIFNFDPANEKLTLKGHQSTAGRTPREINLDPTGKWLIAANQDTDNLVVFYIDQETGLLESTSKNEEVKTACCLVFLDAAE